MAKAKLKQYYSSKQVHTSNEGVRIDKWLWAARFYKTRALAKDAVLSGKVLYNGAAVKNSKEVKLGAKILLKQGLFEKTVVVMGLSHKRGSATQAALLYKETPESERKRKASIAEYKLQKAALPQYGKRPDKKARRQIHRFVRKQNT